MKHFNLLHCCFTFLVIISILVCSILPVFASSGVNVPKSEIQPYVINYSNRYGWLDNLETYLLNPSYSGYFFGVTETNLFQAHTYNYTFTDTNTFNMQIGPKYVPTQGSTLYWNYGIDFSFLDNGYFLDLTGLSDECKILMEFVLDAISIDSSDFTYLQYAIALPMTVTYYDVNGYVLSTQSGNQTSLSFYKDSYSFSCSIDLDIPDYARYCSVSVELKNFSISADKIVNFRFFVHDLKILVAKPTRIITQDYKQIGQVFYQDSYRRDWVILNSADLGSADMTATTSFNSAGSMYNSLKFNALPGDSNQYNLRFRLFFPNRYLKLDNLPVGTSVGVVAQFHISGASSWYFPNAQIAITYYDSFFNVINSASQRWYIQRDYPKIGNNSGGSLSTNFILNYPSNAKYLAVSVILDNFYTLVSSETNITCTCDKFEFWISEDLAIFPTGDDLGDLFDQMGVTRPSPNDILLNISDFLDMNWFLSFSNLLAIFWTSNFLWTLIGVTSAFMTISLIFFGRK